MNEILRSESGFNAGSRGQWGGFASHRREVMAALGLGSGRLCVLGAGNANDLDLPGLLGLYREVRLVDLDAGAIRDGVERQGVLGAPGLVLAGGIDVTAMAGVVGGWSPGTAVDGASLEAMATWPAGRAALAIGGPFEVVASTCLLAPIANQVVRLLGPEHPRLAEAVAATRLGHLRLLAALTGPGGSAWLITDLISTDRLPGPRTEDRDRLVAALAREGRRGGWIHGVDPAAIERDLIHDPEIARRSAGVEGYGAWPWRLHRRQYLVRAWRLRIGR